MVAAKHTPGPWHVDQDPRGDMAWNRSIMADENHAICFMAHGWGFDRDKANADLVAAAPALLDAAKKARAILAADRESLFICHLDPATQEIDRRDVDAIAGLAEYDAALSLIDAAIAKATGSAA